jgi:hypothetical protein
VNAFYGEKRSKGKREVRLTKKQRGHYLPSARERCLGLLYLIYSTYIMTSDSDL